MTTTLTVQGEYFDQASMGRGGEFNSSTKLTFADCRFLNRTSGASSSISAVSAWGVADGIKFQERLGQSSSGHFVIRIHCAGFLGSARGCCAKPAADAAQEFGSVGNKHIEGSWICLTGTTCPETTNVDGQLIRTLLLPDPALRIEPCPCLFCRVRS